MTNPSGATDDALDRAVRDIQNALDACRRAMVDFDIERQRIVMVELDRWVALEEASHQTQQ